MTKLDRIPDNFTHLDESGLLGDSDELSIRDLEQFDRQLKPFGLEIVHFDNGSALNWFIQHRRE